MKKKIAAIIMSLGLILGFGAVAAPAANAVSVGTCHVRAAYHMGYPTNFTIRYLNYTAWETWASGGYNRDGYYIKYQSSRVWSEPMHEYIGTSFPTWGKFLYWC